MQLIKVNFKNRLRVRRVDEEDLLLNALEKAKERNESVILSRHGGDVANSYGYKAETEGAIAVGFPNGDGYVQVERLAANKVTSAGIFRRVWGQHGLFDNRFGKSKKDAMRVEFVNAVKEKINSARN